MRTQVYWCCCLCLEILWSEILLIKHRARGTLLSQQSLAMWKHTMYIGKQDKEAQQKGRKWMFFFLLCFAFFSWQEVEAKLGEQTFWPKVVTVVINQRSKGFPTRGKPKQGDQPFFCWLKGKTLKYFAMKNKCVELICFGRSKNPKGKNENGCLIIVLQWQRKFWM